MCLWSITKHLLDQYQLFYDGPLLPSYEGNKARIFIFLFC